jgi:hypothetical protein
VLASLGNWSRQLDLSPRPAWELRWLAAILVLAAALRIVWVAYAAREPQGVHDPIFYHGYARSIAAGIGYQLPDGYTAYYPIGYPAVLGVVFALVTHTPIPDNLELTAGYLQVFLGVATVALAYEVGRRLFSPAVGLLTGVWIAVFPNLIYHTATYLTETLFNLIVMAALAVLLWSPWRDGPPGWARIAVFGALVGGSALVRPISLLFLPLLPIAWLVAGGDWRRAAQYTGIAAVMTAAVILPWTVRNVIVMDAPVIISTNLGDNLCMGHYPGARGHFALPEHCFPEDEYAGLSREEFEVRRNDDNTRRAIRFAVDHPVVELKLLSRKAYYTWEHDHDGLWAVESYGDDPFIDDGLRTALERVADVFFYVTISLGGLGLVGLVLPWGDGRRIFFLLALLSLAGIPLVFFGDARFHVPAVPLLALSAAWLAVSMRDAPRLARGFVARRSGVVEVADGELTASQQDALQDP